MDGHNPTPIPATPSPQENNGRDSLPNSFEGLAQKRRGVQPGTKRGPYKGSRPAEPPAHIIPVPLPQFTPESVRPIVSLPFNLATAKTGFEGFLLTEDEAKTLSVSGATVFNTWIQIDPKYVALIMFSISMMSITAEKSLLYHRAMRQAEDERRERESNGVAVK